jgi:hypothetical protein
VDGGDGQMVRYWDCDTGSAIYTAMIMGKGKRTMLKIKRQLLLLLLLLWFCNCVLLVV